MEVAHISKVIEMVKVGCTCPYRAITDDGINVFLKTYNNCEGNRVLFNEWVSYNLAEIFQLPIPKAFWAVIDQDTDFEVSLNQENWGLCFCSTLVEKAAIINPSVTKFVSNPSEIVPVILFDNWIYNADRNIKNLLFDFRQMKFFIIDHSHVFADAPDWTVFDLDQISSRNITSDRTIMIENSKTYSFFYELLGKSNLDFDTVAKMKFPLFNRQLIHDIIYSTPELILPSPEECTALTRFLVNRADNHEQICGSINRYMMGR